MNRREQSRLERRGRVLEAARRLIAHDGVDALTMRGLAAEAGLAVNTVYALFGRSRDDILEAIVEDGLAELDRMLHEKQPDDPLAEGLALVAIVVDFLLENEDVFRPVLLAEAHANVGWGDAQAIAQGRASLEAAARGGVIREDADLDLLGEHVFQSFRTLAWRWARGELDGREFRTRWLYVTQLTFLAVATDEARPEVERAFRAVERQLSRATSAVARERRHRS